ncbi:MAG: T9SS type A sorting domain-containing protein [Bacteroidota bacterium]
MSKTFNVTTGNWNNGANWLPTGVPDVTDDVTIPSGRTVTIDIAATCASLSFGNSTNVSVNVSIVGTNSLTVAGAINFIDPIGSTGDQTIAVGAGTLTCNTVVFAVTTNGNEDNTITVSTGTINVAGDITFNGLSNENAITFLGAATLNVGGNITGTGTFTVSTAGSTVNYNGTSAQTIKAASYANLTISGARTTNNVTLSGAINIAGIFTNAATFTSGVYVITGSTINYNGTIAQTVIPFNYNSLTISGARTTNNVTIANTGTITIATTFTNSATYTTGSLITSGTTIEYNGTTAQTIVGITYNNLTISGARTTTNITLVNGGTITILGTFTSTATFTSGRYVATGNTFEYNSSAAQTVAAINYNNLTISGARGANNVTLDNNGTIGIAGAFTNAASFTSGSLITTGTTINYNGTTAQTIMPIDYTNLTISGARTVNSITVGGTINISGTFASSATFTTGAYITAGSTINYNGTGAQTVIAFNYNNLTVSGARTSNNVTFTGVVNIAGTFTPSATFTSGVLVFTGSTINYNGTGSQTVLALNYVNLTISGARTTNDVTLSNSGTIGISGVFTHSATYTSGSLITTGTNINYNGNTAQTIAALTYNDLTVSGTRTTTSVTLVNGGTIIVTGNFTNSATFTSGNFIGTNNTFEYNSTTAQTIVAINYGNLTISGARGTNNVTLASSGTIGVSGTLTLSATFSSGDFINTGSTIAYNGTGAQTVIAFDYNNLTISGARTTNSVTLGSAITIGGAFVSSATFTTGAYITTGNTINYNSSNAQTIIAFNYNDLTITGARTTNNITLVSGTIGVAGTFTNSATFTSGTIVTTGNTFNFNGTGAQTVNAFDYNILTISGARTTNNVTLSPTGTIAIAGNLNNTATFTSGAFITTNSNINLNGAAQNIPNFTFNNLTCAGTGTKTATADITVNGILTINSGVILNMVTFTLNGVASTSGTGTMNTQNVSVTPIPTAENWTFTVQYNSASAQNIVEGNYTNINGTGGNRTLSPTGTIGIAGTFTVGAGTYTNTGSTVDFNGTGAQTVPTTNYNNIIISGTRTSNNVTISGVVNIAGTFTTSATFTTGAIVITGSTFNFNSIGAQTIPALNYTNLTISGARTTNDVTLSNSGTIGISGVFTHSATYTSGSLITTGTTINYNGNSVQTVIPLTYNNLTVSGTRAATSVTLANGGTITVIGNFINSASFTSGTFISTGNTFEYISTAAQTIVAINYNNLTIGGARGANNVTLASSGIIGIGNTFTNSASFTTGTFITTGSSVAYNGTGAQTVIAFDYDNISITRTRTTNNVTLSGNINIAGTFTNSASFTTGAFITTGSTVNYNSSNAQTIIAFNYDNLTISGARASNNITLVNGGTIGVAGTFTNSATFTSGIIITSGNTFNFNGTGAQTVNAFDYNILTISGARTTNNVTLSPTGTIAIAGNLNNTATFTSGAFITTNSNINLNGAAQNIPNFTFNNLTCAGSNTKTATADITVNGVLTINSGVTLNMVTFTLNGVSSTSGTGTLNTQSVATTPIPSGKTWTCAVAYNSASAQNIVDGNYTNLTGTGGNRTLSPTGTIGIAGIFTIGAGTYTNTSSTVDFNGTIAQTVPAFNYNNLTISGARTTSNVTLVNGGTIGIAGTFSNTASFTSGTFVNTANTINYNGITTQTVRAFNYNNLTISGARTTNDVTLANSGTIAIAGAFTASATFTSGTIVNTGSTIEFNGTTAQTVPAFNYNNLVVSGARTTTSVTLVNGGTIGVAGTFTSSATFTSGTIVTTGNTFEFNGTGAQTVNAFNYNVLTISGARTTNNVTLSPTGTIAIAGNLNNTATFTLGSFITTNSNINLNGAAQNIPNFTFNNLTCAGTSTKTATADITVNGILTINSGVTLNMVTFTLNGIASTSGTGTLNTQSVATTPIPSGETWTCSVVYNSASAQNIVAGDYTNLNGTGGNRVLTNTGTIAISGTFTVGAGTYTNTGSTIDFDGTGAQTINAFNYNNLIVSGARTTNNVTLVNGGTIGVAGTFTSSATFTSGTIVVTGNTFDFNGTGAQTVNAFNYNILTISGARTTNNVTLSPTGTIAIAGNLNNTATFTSGSFITTNSNISLTGAAQNIPNFTFNNLTCAGTSTKTATADITVNGILTINSGVVLNMVTFTLNGVASTSGTGTLNTQSVATTPVPSGETWTCSVVYNSASAQNIVVGDYTNLNGTGGNRILANTGTIGISGTFTVGSGTYTNTGSTIDFDGTGVQTVPALSYNNLTISGARTTNNVTISGVVNIAGTFTPSATFTSGAFVNTGSTINYNGTAAQTVGAFNYNNLTISGARTTNNVTLANSGTINIAGTFTASATFTSGAIVNTGSNINFNGITAQTVPAFSYNDLTISGARTTTNVTLVNGGTIAIAGTFTPSATFSTGNYVVTANTVNFNGAAQNIPAFTFTNLTCSGSGSKTATGNVIVSGALNIAANTFIINGNQLSLNGTLTGTPVFVGSSSSVLSIAGTGALGSNINFSQSSISTRSLLNLVISRTSSTITLANPLEIIGTLTMNNGTLASAGNLKLISSLNSTARIAQVQGTGAVTGNVIVQRFINASARRYRFLSSPISNGTLEGWRGDIFLTGNNLPTAHQSTTVGGGLNWGFDATVSNQASVFTYNETVLGNLDLGYTEVKNTTTSLTNVPLTIGRGYRVFIRGDRSNIGRLNGGNNTQNEVTMDLVGTLNTGDIPMPVTFTNSGTLSDDGWCLVGNPYACEYDWNALWDAGNGGGNSGTFYTNVDPTVYVFDPNSNSFKSYNAASNSGTISNGIIPSGQAFFIKATAASPALTFKEQFKALGVPTAMFKTGSSSTDEFSIRLKYDSINYDDFIMKFISGTTKNHDRYDIVKYTNPNFNLASYGRDSIYHALDARPQITANDTILLNVTGVNGTHKLIVQNIPATGKYFYLVDKFLNLKVPLTNAVEYVFTIQTANAKSYGKDRFIILVSNSATLPVKISSLNAQLVNNKKAQVNWVTSLEINNNYFEVQRSIDAINFEVIGKVKGNGNANKTINYSYDDDISAVNATTIYYRLNQIDYDGTSTLSSIKAVNHELETSNENTCQIFPNPAVNKVNLTFSKTITGKVEIKIFSQQGLLVDVIPVNPATNPTFEIDLGHLDSGCYIVETLDSNNNKFVTKMLKL